MGSDTSTPGQSDTITIRNTSTGHQFTYTLTGSESTDSNSQDNGEELLSVFATEFEEHQSNTGQFDDVESISAYSTGSGNPYGLEFLTDQGSNYQITFSDSSGGSDSFNSPSISSVDGANFLEVGDVSVTGVQVVLIMNFTKRQHRHKKLHQMLIVPMSMLVEILLLRPRH